MASTNDINQLIATDPEIQAIVRQVWGDTTVNQRPGDTPKNLEKANHNASEQIKRILAQRGIELPSRSFVNPRTNSLENAHGWAGLPTAAKIAIIGGAAAGGLGLAGSLGAFGGAAGAGSGAAASTGAAAVPSLGVTGGISGVALPTVGTGASVAAKGGLLGGLSKLFGKGGIDPTALSLGLMSSLFGGDDGAGAPQSYHKGVSSEAARLVDPIQSLYNALNGSNNMGVGLNNLLRQGPNLRSSYVPAPPAPVRIPGLNLQIGGGLGTDPALKDPSLLSMPMEGDMYSSILPQQNVQKGFDYMPKRRGGQ